MNVTIIYASESGNAEMCANSISDVLRDEFHPQVVDISDMTVDQLRLYDTSLFVCASYGEGDVPNSALAFFDEISGGGVDLAGVRFAMFGLGDTFYDTYNRGADRLAEQLRACGALQFGEHARHDASSGEPPEEMAEEWAVAVAAQISAEIQGVA